jgi:hypothetical protein
VTEACRILPAQRARRGYDHHAMRAPRLPIATLIMVAACGGSPEPSRHDAGHADASVLPVIHACDGWGDHGQVLGEPRGSSKAIVADADGAVTIVRALGSESPVFRLRADGSFDPAFGDLGVLADPTIPFVTSLTPRADGWYLGGKGLVGISATGVVDPQGCRLDGAALGGNVIAMREVAGKLVLVLEAPPGSFVIERRDLACALDPTFGTGGVVSIDEDPFWRPAILGDGSVVLARAGDGGFYFTRLDPTGERQLGWGEQDGRTNISLPIGIFAGRGPVLAFAVGSDGAITFAGEGPVVGDGPHVLVKRLGRLSPEGTLVEGFGGDLRWLPISPRAMAILPDGGAMLAGTDDNPDSGEAVARIAFDGQIEWASGAHGLSPLGFGAITDIGGDRVVAAGNDIAACYDTHP